MTSCEDVTSWPDAFMVAVVVLAVAGWLPLLIWVMGRRK
jgi:hypothetical protein